MSRNADRYLKFSYAETQQYIRNKVINIPPLLKGIATGKGKGKCFPYSFASVWPGLIPVYRQTALTNYKLLV